MAERVLVFSPHPADNVIGCGASMVKHIRAGREVFVVYAGDTGPVDCAYMASHEYGEKQVAETSAANAALGIPPEHVRSLEQYPWKYDGEKLRFEFMELLRDIRPRICYLPHPKENHIDYQVVSNAAMHATGMAPSPWFRKFGDARPTFRVECVLAYEVWTPLESPNYFEPFDEDIWAVKAMVLGQHPTQEVDKYILAVKGLNTYRATMHEGEVAGFAEAFQVLRTSRPF